MSDVFGSIADRTITIRTPDYDNDRLFWKVFAGPVLIGVFFSMWEAEQFATGVSREYPGYELEVI